MTAIPPLSRSAVEDRWRRTLLGAIPVAVLAFLIGLLLDPLAHQSTPFDEVAYPVLIAGMLLLEVLLWRLYTSTGTIVTVVVLAVSAFFLSKLVYVLFFLPPGASVQAEMTESFFWIPAIYVLSLFVPDLRIARGSSFAFFGGLVLVSLCYAARSPLTPRTIGVLFALIELNLANLTLLTLTNVFIGYKDTMARSRAHSEAMQQLAHTDLLTDLPNRLAVETELAQLTREQQPFSLLFIDIDGFKLVNDTLGHSAGDEVLRQLAGRLTLALKAGDIAARISGDEFVVIFKRTTPDRALVLAQHVLDDLTRPFEAQGKVIQLTTSIGIAAYPHDAQDADTVLRHADAAMYHVKSSGKNSVRRFDGALDAQLEQRKLLEREFQFALVKEQLSVVYQPIFQLETGALIKVEALLRWQHPDFGAVSPGSFIAMAEQSGQIVQVGAWVLQTACRQARDWREATGLPVRVTVNVSPLQFAQQNFVSLVKDALLRSGLPASALELELTEGALIRHPDAVQSALRELQRLGVSISIDDFGTGYSSLSYLRDLPIDCIKIDRSFIADLATPRRAPQYTMALVEAIVGIARTLDLQVVAEGIETETQLDLVRNLGCDHGQGYYFARPMAQQEVLALLQHENGTAERAPLRLN